MTVHLASVPTATEAEPRAGSAERGDRASCTADLLARAGDADSPSDREVLIAQVVEANMRVAEAIAARYRHRGIGADDLQQVAYLALTKAARGYDASSGHDFLSYAVPTIRGELRRYFRDHGWMVRPPRRVQELQARIFAAEAELCLGLGRSPKVSEIAAHLDEPVADVEEALAAEGCFTPASLDRPLDTEDSSASTVGELLGGEETGSGAAEARVILAPVVRRLSDRDRMVLRLRFFDDYTQREIADELGVTQTQVSRILSRIMRLLREQLEDPASTSDDPSTHRMSG
jgi:RNA polymerase sigma-B factor